MTQLCESLYTTHNKKLWWWWWWMWLRIPVLVAHLRTRRKKFKSKIEKHKQPKVCSVACYKNDTTARVLLECGGY